MFLDRKELESIFWAIVFVVVWLAIGGFAEMFHPKPFPPQVIEPF